MSHEMVRFKAGNDAFRELPDTEQTEQYLMKLSFAAEVRVEFATGEWWLLHCGEIVDSLGQTLRGY